MQEHADDPRQTLLTAETWEAAVTAALTELNALFRDQEGFVQEFAARHDSRGLEVQVPDSDATDGIRCRWLPSLAMALPNECLPLMVPGEGAPGVELHNHSTGLCHGFYANRPVARFQESVVNELLEACFQVGFLVGQDSRDRWVFLDTAVPILPRRSRR
jgi:hypothetical protein